VHHYDRQRAGQPERRAAVVTVIDNDLKPFLAQQHVPVIEGITHELVGKLAARLAALDAAEEMQPEPWPELNGRTEITLTEAAALPGTSRATISSPPLRGSNHHQKVASEAFQSLPCPVNR
jgi:hypothetical protein